MNYPCIEASIRKNYETSQFSSQSGKSSEESIVSKNYQKSTSSVSRNASGLSTMQRAATRMIYASRNETMRQDLNKK